MPPFHGDHVVRAHTPFGLILGLLAEAAALAVSCRGSGLWAHLDFWPVEEHLHWPPAKLLPEVPAPLGPPRATLPGQPAAESPSGERPSERPSAARPTEKPSTLEASGATKRWAICVTGQLSRLELESKVENLFKELQRRKELVHVFFVMEVGSNYFVNKKTNRGAGKDCAKDGFTQEDLREELGAWYRAGSFMSHQDFSGELVMSRWPRYGDDKNRDPKKRLASHFSQWRHIAECARLIQESEGDVRYTDLLRIRDDSIVTRPFPVERVRHRGIAVKRSQGWGGLNDKAIYASRTFLLPAFTAVLRLATQINTDTLPRKLRWKARRIENPEQMLELALDDYPVAQISPSRMVMVTGRCRPPGRRFCLVTQFKDTRPKSAKLWAPPCAPEPG